MLENRWLLNQFKRQTITVKALNKLELRSLWKARELWVSELLGRMMTDWQKQKQIKFGKTPVLTYPNGKPGRCAQEIKAEKLGHRWNSILTSKQNASWTQFNPILRLSLQTKKWLRGEAKALEQLIARSSAILRQDIMKYQTLRAKIGRIQLMLTLWEWLAMRNWESSKKKLSKILCSDLPNFRDPTIWYNQRIFCLEFTKKPILRLQLQWAEQMPAVFGWGITN